MVLVVYSFQMAMVLVERGCISPAKVLLVVSHSTARSSILEPSTNSFRHFQRQVLHGVLQPPT